MKNKEVISLLKKDVNQLTPDSFSSIKNKIEKTDAYLVYKVKQEGEQIVPNNYEEIENQIPKPKPKFIKPLILSLSGAVAAFIVIFPITLLVSRSGNDIQNSDNIKAGTIELIIKDSTKENETVDVFFSFDQNNNVISETVHGIGEISQLALLDIDKKQSNENFISDLINKFSNSKLFNKKNSLNIIYKYYYPNSYNSYDLTLFNQLNEKINKDITYTLNRSSFNENGSIKEILKLNDALFDFNIADYIPFEANINTFLPITKENNPFLIPINSTIGRNENYYIDLTLNEIYNTYKSLQTDDNITKFRKDLLIYESIYQNRKYNLNNLLINASNGYTDILNISEQQDLLWNSSWWNDDYLNENLFYPEQIINNQIWLDDYTNIKTLYPTKDNAKEDDKHFIVNDLVDRMRENEKFHGYMFRLIPYKYQLKDNKGKNYFDDSNIDLYWSKTDTEWINYWKEIYQKL